MKKSVVISIVIMLLISCIMVSSCSDQNNELSDTESNNETTDNYEWITFKLNSDGKSYSVCSLNEHMGQEDVVIPSTYKG